MIQANDFSEKKRKDKLKQRDEEIHVGNQKLSVNCWP